ncbi:hypothetical protein [Ideonella sp. A 288]|uniref:hypothetical protein n=1 Tax=Ideonella sp. A 288 TaxID=1962181 RepID=UPI000B4A9453|nr:hypothetical protein [Ideonella sp. A 288]
MQRVHPILGKALPARLLRRTASAAAVFCLTGCAALQIDVDVYKGPLVHDEDTQVQQLASIAMSAKAVMLIQRNKWLDEVYAGWRENALNQASKDVANSALTRFIRSDEWQGLDVACTKASDACRRARLINDMLSAYDNKAAPVLAQPLEQLRSAHARYQETKLTYDRAKKAAAVNKAPTTSPAQQETSEQLAAKVAAQWAEQKALEASTEALRPTWGALVDLLVQSKQLLAVNTRDATLRAVEWQSADILAQLTHPVRLACANPDLPANGELLRGLQAASKSIEAAVGRENSALAAAEAGASRHLAGSLRMANAQELMALKPVMETVTGTGCTFSNTLSPGSIQTKQRVPTRESSLLANATRQGVQREATAEVMAEIDAMLRDLQQTTASGFDHGRPQLGLDRLADDAANQRNRDRNSKTKAGDLITLADSTETKRLQDGVVDLASRMQFLAVNLGLVDDKTASSSLSHPFDTLGAGFSTTPATSRAEEDARAFKATLEVIANSLLVLAEDQRRQRFQRADQEAFANHEYQSAVQAFQIDPAKRFDHLVEHYRTSKTRAAGTEAAQLAKLEKTAKDAVAAQTAASVQTQRLADAVLVPRQLLLTLVRDLPAGVTTSFKADPGDAADNWAADATKLRTALAAAPAKTSVADVLKLAQAWLEQQANVAQTKGGAHLQRLVAAQEAMRGLQATAPTTALARAEVIAKLDTEVINSWTVAHAAHQASQAQLTERGGELTTADTAVKDHKKAKHPSYHIQSALDAVVAARAAVLAQATAGKGAHDVDTMAGLVKVELQKLPAEPTGLKTEAINQLDQWAATAPRTLKLPEKLDGSPNSALNTLDRIEAFLSYTRVDALNRGSTAGAEQATAALDALMARRERMSYLRPASTYLRSALATTSQQTDPALEWSNLLAATVKRLSGEYDISKQRERDVRGELDKSFWQNVNKVRVSAGGDSNFAIAKDDVGNWYVKAMGADLGPMIKAAKSLALYNLGGRVDTNLLRIDELRGQSNRQPGSADDLELQRLVGRQSGAATSAYGNTLKVFADNHATTVNGLLEELDTRLKANGLATELGKRWDSTYAAEEGQRAALPNLNTSGGEALAALHTQALAATGDGLAKIAGTTPSAQLLKALGLLAQQRTLLRDQVNGTALLLNAALEGDQKRRSEVETLVKALALAQTNRTEPAKELAALQSQFDGATGEANATRRAELAPKLAAQQKVVNEMGDQIAELHNQLTAAQELARQAAATLAAARDRKARALAEVDAVWARYVKDMAARHLRAVEEMETAARVVSQGVQGKPSKP